VASSAAEPPTTTPGRGALSAATPAAQAFDPAAATRTYLARLSPEEKSRSDSYFEGGYWLSLWNFLLGAAISLLLLQTGWSARMRSIAERLTRFGPLQTAIYWGEYLLLTTLLTFPMAMYQGFVREHRYGLATQMFLAWLGDRGKGLLLHLFLGGIAVVVLYAVVRRLPRTWWIWGAVVALGFVMVTALIGPVFIQPLFNRYTRLTDEVIRDPILRLARANGIHADDVYQVDASRQSTRISANVSGFLGTERITLNDNLLKRASLPEIEAVMGHEMGHYVLNHIYKGLVFAFILITVGFAVLRWGFERALRRWGTRWGVRSIGDVAGLPLVVLIVSIYGFVIRPIQNTWTRTAEFEADVFGLNAARQPDGMAEVSLKLGEYRKLDPGPIEEWIFYDHPSGRVRIHTAMRWKAENLP